MVQIVSYKEFFNKEYDGKGILSTDICKKPTVGIISNGATMIPLCMDCLVRIESEIKDLVEGQ